VARYIHTETKKPRSTFDLIQRTCRCRNNRRYTCQLAVRRLHELLWGQLPAQKNIGPATVRKEGPDSHFQRSSRYGETACSCWSLTRQQPFMRRPRICSVHVHVFTREGAGTSRQHRACKTVIIQMIEHARHPPLEAILTVTLWPDAPSARPITHQSLGVGIQHRAVANIQVRTFRHIARSPVVE